MVDGENIAQANDGEDLVSSPSLDRRALLRYGAFAAGGIALPLLGAVPGAHNGASPGAHKTSRTCSRLGSQSDQV